MKSIQNKQAFTLIETMVAMTIFMMVISMASGLFIISSKAQKKAALTQKIQSDARLILGTVSEYIRETTIDYNYPGYLGGIVNPVSDLALLDSEGKSIVFSYIDDVNICPKSGSPCLALSVENGSWDSLTSSQVKVSGDGIRFYIRPDQDPFKVSGTDFLSDTQPGVTIVLSLENDNPIEEFRNRTFFQTTVSTRKYGR